MSLLYLSEPVTFLLFSHASAFFRRNTGYSPPRPSFCLGFSSEGRGLSCSGRHARLDRLPALKQLNLRDGICAKQARETTCPSCTDKLCASRVQGLEIDFTMECMENIRQASLQSASHFCISASAPFRPSLAVNESRPLYAQSRAAGIRASHRHAARGILHGHG